MSRTFSTIADRRKRGTYDVLLELRPITAAAIAATTNETGIEFASRKCAQFKVCFALAAYTGYVASSAEWIINVAVSATLGGTYTTVASVAASVAAGAALETSLVIGSNLVASIVPAAEFIRVSAVRVGASGNLSYSAWITDV